MAVGTIMPLPRFTGFDSNGDPVSGGQLWTYIAGTSTPATTYSDVALTVPHANPIILNSAGRPASGGSELGIYLTPGSSYKFVLLSATGATIWTQDNVAAVPTSSQTVDVIGTAGQALPAGSAVYLSSGVRGTTAGQWYLADADFPDASSLATSIGIAIATVPFAAQGAIRTTGTVAIPGATLTPGTVYYASTTAGALTPTLPLNNARAIGQAMDVTTLILGGTTPFAASPQTIQGAGGAALVLTDLSQGTDLKTFRLLNQSQILQVQALNDAQTAALTTPMYWNRGGDALVARDLFEKGRAAPLGAWIDVPYSAANFTASSGTWTVPTGSVAAYCYTLVGKTLFLSFAIGAGTTLSTATPVLGIALPVGLVGARLTRAPLVYFGPQSVGYAEVALGGTAVGLNRDFAATAWASGSGPFLAANFAIPIQ